MKIGIVRHFEVDMDKNNKKMTWDEYKREMEQYDIEDVIPTDVDLRGIEWNKCYSSSLPRAVKTAEAIFDGDIKIFDELREVDLRVMTEVRGENDMNAWSIYSLLGWATNQENIGETISKSRRRVNRFLDALESYGKPGDNILIVCHGMIMKILEEQLFLRGYLGDADVVFPENGELYLFERYDI